MNSHSAVIFDFDGTMADSIPLIRKIYTELAEKNNWTVLTDKQYEILRKGSLGEARKWAGIRFWQLPSIYRSARKLMRLESEKVKLFTGMTELVRELRERGCDVYVLSRNSSDTIAHVLERHDILDEVQILARRKRTLGSKSAVIRRLVMEKGYDRRKVWMVGDEVRDLQAASITGVNSVAVKWGIQDIGLLKKYNPTHDASNVKQLREILLNSIKKEK